MSITDPIADALTIIRNGNSSKKKSVDVPFSKVINEILLILKREGFIFNYKTMDEAVRKMIRVYFRFSNNKSVLNGITRISKPGLRIYKKSKDIKRVLRGYGIAIISTSKGLMTDKDAREGKAGGEVICHVW